ncbi:hypothetical protein [Paenibacillus sp. PL2-23]|uniref:hypothetical protein n=1 Tax=Paenibacillus sp. PL2-23 TaxID=2100729 RepID=UPI0030F8904A
MKPDIAKSLRELGWGLIFTLVDFHLGVFDILPDVIGYVIILLALNKLRAGEGNFKPARWLAAVLIPLSLPQLVTKTNLDLNDLGAAPMEVHLYTQGMTVLHGLLLYFIFREIYAHFKPLAPAELMYSLFVRLRLYMALFAAQLIIYPFLFNWSESLMTPFILLGAAMLISELLLIRIPFRLSRVRLDSGGVEKELGNRIDQRI